MVATMTPSTQVPVLLKITTMLMMVVVIMTMTLNIITVTMVLISAIIIIIIVVMIIIIRATRMRPAPPAPRPPPWNAKLNPGPSSPLVTVSFASWGWWGGARFEGFVPGAGCPLGLPLAILATRFSMCGGDEANCVDGRY